MTSPIERFKDSYQNWRYNPFTAADMAVDKSEDGLVIPSGSPFVIQLLELPRKNDPTSVSVRCYGVDTTVDQDSASGQLILYVADTTGFSPGDNIIIHRGGAREEERIIDTVQAGISLTVTVNLTYPHTAVQADPVEKFIAFTETVGSPAQSQFRVDYPPDDGEGTGLVEFNQNDAEKEVRVNYKATGSPALSETLDTKISYPAETPADDRFVGFSSGAPVWRQFSHNNLVGVTADQHHAQSHTLASHSTKAHSELTGIGINDHHPKLHAAAHHSGGGDALAFASIAGFGTYLDQAVKQASSPTFNNLNLSGDGTITAGDDLYLEAAGYVKSHTNRDHTTGAAATAIIGTSEGAFFRSTSALKYKDNVKNLEVDSSLIYKLRPVSFNSKCKGDDKNRRFIGLIADEIEKYYPDIINYNEKKEAESYDHQMITTLLLAEVQKINERVKKLEA